MGLTACQTTISESDIFRPGDAKNTTVSSSDKGVFAITDNIPREGLWDDLKVVNKDGTLAGQQGDISFRISRQSRNDAPLFVYCNGNSSDIPNHGDLNTYKFSSFGDVLQWDYPGYGLSKGTASYEAIVQASDVVLAAIDGMKRKPNQPVIFYGYSLGSFVCSDMARRANNIDGLILEAAAPSAKSTEPYLVPKLLRAFVKPKFPESLQGIDNVAALSGVDVKILLMSGGKDKILPVALSRSFHQQLEQAGHTVTYREYKDADHFTISWQDDFDGDLNRFIGNVTQ